jgi:hypothetical protein
MPLAQQLSNLTADPTSLSRLRLVAEASARIGCNFCQLLPVFPPAITAPDFEEPRFGCSAGKSTGPIPTEIREGLEALLWTRCGSASEVNCSPVSAVQ